MSRPDALLVAGAPGSGKSTLAAALAPRLGAALLDLDTATGPLTSVIAGLIGAADFSDPRIAALTRAQRYGTLFDLAVANLRAGLPVVLVAPFTVECSPAGWRAVGDRLAPFAGSVTLVWLHLPPEAVTERLRRRGAARDMTKILSRRTDPAPPAVPHLALDATFPVRVLVTRLIDDLARLGVAIDGTT